MMLVIAIMAARPIVRRLAVPSTLSSRLSMGGIGFGLMLIAEFTLVLWFRGLSIGDYIAGRDTVAAIVYYATLVAFAILPLLVARR